MEGIVGLAREQLTLWWITVGIGAVVALVVVLLLTLLVRLVRDIERGVTGVWEMGKRVAANTATTWMLNETGALVDELRRETAGTNGSTLTGRR